MPALDLDLVAALITEPRQIGLLLRLTASQAGTRDAGGLRYDDYMDACMERERLMVAAATALGILERRALKENDASAALPLAA